MDQNYGSILARSVLRVKFFWVELVRVIRAQNWAAKFGFMLGLVLQGTKLGRVAMDLGSECFKWIKIWSSSGWVLRFWF